MPGPQKHVVFDAVGTLVSYDVFFDTIESQLGDKLKGEGIKPSFFGFTWIEVAEREYTYLSVSGRYAPFQTLMKGLFYRLLHQAGIQDPHSFATDKDLEVILDAYSNLRCRPGVKEVLEKLHEAGWNCWILTAGDRKRVKGYFAGSGVPMSDDKIMTTDDIKIGKPDPAAYKFIFEKFEKDDIKYFFAAHNWDVSAATTVGFKGAYSSVWEKDPCYEVFGKVDVVGDSLLETATNLIEAER